MNTDPYVPTQDTFDKAIEAHELTVLYDDNGYRHLSFGIPGSTTMRIEIVTFPDHLVYAGDMGDFVLRRKHDLLGWFEGATRTYLNAEYIAEKVQTGQTKEFSPKKFKKIVEQIRQDWAESRHENEHSQDFIESFSPHNYEHITDRTEAFQFLSELRDGDRVETDWHDHDLDDFTYRFIWALRAIRHVISVYRTQRLEAMPQGLCADRDEHEPHLVTEGSLAPFRCTANQESRLPWAADRRLKELNDEH